jgi:hypothetical protein
VAAVRAESAAEEVMAASGSPMLARCGRHRVGSAADLCQ